MARHEWLRLPRTSAVKLAKWTLAGLSELAVSMLPGAIVLLPEGSVVDAAGVLSEVPPCDIQDLDAAMFVVETEAWLRSL
jgi:hypothetical protein